MHVVYSLYINIMRLTGIECYSSPPLLCDVYKAGTAIAPSEGQFKTLTGRGKPLQRETAEGNPFIGREEFFMNRIVQRQGAAPPWVEIQHGQHTSSLFVSTSGLTLAC